MPLTNAGRDFLVGATMGDEVTLFDDANAHIGVGNGTAAFDATQTDLQGTSTFRKGMDSGFPARDPDNLGEYNKYRFKSTFGDAEANFTWEEWGIFNANAGGTMLNRKVEFNGTKQPGQTWIFEVDIEVQIGA